MAIVCKECGTPIPDGKMFCPSCAAEVRLVPDFDAYELHKEQKRLEALKLREEYSERIRTQSTDSDTSDRPSAGQVILASVLALLVIAAGAAGIFFWQSRQRQIRYASDPAYQFEHAQTAYADGDLEKALAYCRQTLALTPDSKEASLLMAAIYEEQGNTAEAVSLLRALISADDDESALRQLISICRKAGDNEAVAQLVRNTGRGAIIQEFGDYVAVEPELSLVSGRIYPYGTRLELTGSGGEIYYTTDGSVPDETSLKYVGPILLDKGTVRINAVLINAYHVKSEIVSGSYTVTLPVTPKPTPTVRPTPTAAPSYDDSDDGDDYSSGGGHDNYDSYDGGGNDQPAEEEAPSNDAPAHDEDPGTDEEDAEDDPFYDGNEDWDEALPFESAKAE